MTRSRSDSTEGLRVQCRLVLTHPLKQRWDADGRELLELRGTIVDAGCTHPQAVVRFAGKQQQELYHWSAIGNHLVVEGHLEVKTWSNGTQQCLALLIEADNIFPLNPATTDLSRLGVYRTTEAVGDRGGVVRVPRNGSRAARADALRKALDEA